jgi:aspartyl aminopeptidase
MASELEFAHDLISFIHSSPSPFHVVQRMEDLLAAKGFRKLELAGRWALAEGGKYYVTRNGSALIAFVVGGGDVEEEGFRLIAAHTDTPSFRIKPSPEIVVEKAYLSLNTETYDSPILNTWLDRPLSMAGRVSLKTANPFRPVTRLVHWNKPLLIIPNQSRHMNRKVNEGIELNKQKDMLPLLARINEEFISSTRLDDLAMVHAGLHALLEAEANRATYVLVCYDNEEVGSQTKQGAASPMLRTGLERIVLVMGKDREDFFRAIYHSFLVSADMGHGLHPSAADKLDPVHRPVLNGGPMIKIAANQNLTTDSDTATVYQALCEDAGIPVQKFVSRSDLPGGSTIGPISAGHLDIRAVDVGNPAMAMHSICELCGVLDHQYIKRSFVAFYGA